MSDKFYSERATVHPLACDATKRKARFALYSARKYQKRKALEAARAVCIILTPGIKRGAK